MWHNKGKSCTYYACLVAKRRREPGPADSLDFDQWVLSNKIHTLG